MRLRCFPAFFSRFLCAGTGHSFRSLCFDSSDLYEKTVVTQSQLRVSGYRVMPTVTSRAVGTQLVHVRIPGQVTMHAYGEVLEIFQVDQHPREGKQVLWFARMRWFKPYQGNPERAQEIRARTTSNTFF